MKKVYCFSHIHLNLRNKLTKLLVVLTNLFFTVQYLVSGYIIPDYLTIRLDIICSESLYLGQYRDLGASRIQVRFLPESHAIDVYKFAFEHSIHRNPSTILIDK